MEIALMCILGFFLGMLAICLIIFLDEHIRTIYRARLHQKMQETNPPKPRNPIGFGKNISHE